MIGEKIRALRIQKKMTQAELAGSFITRNMLSQIENGVAMPSVPTVLELAKRLDVPASYFFSDAGTLDDYRKIGALDKIKKLTGLDLREFDNAITFKVALMVRSYLTSKNNRY